MEDKKKTALWELPLLFFFVVTITLGVGSLMGMGKIYSSNWRQCQTFCEPNDGLLSVDWLWNYCTCMNKAEGYAGE